MRHAASGSASAPFCSSHTRASQPPALCACRVVSLEARRTHSGATTAAYHERNPALPRRRARVGHGGGHALQVPGGAAGAAGVGAGASAPGPRVRRTSPPSAWGTARRANRPGRPRPPRCAASPGATPARARPTLRSRFGAPLCSRLPCLRGAHDGAQLRLQRRAQRYVVLRRVAQAWQDDDRGWRCSAGRNDTRSGAAAQRRAPRRDALRRATHRATRWRGRRQHECGRRCGVAGECPSLDASMPLPHDATTPDADGCWSLLSCVRDVTETSSRWRALITRSQQLALLWRPALRTRPHPQLLLLPLGRPRRSPAAAPSPPLQRPSPPACAPGTCHTRRAR